MGAYKTLHFKENGYVVKCHQCRHILIAFGNIAVCHTEEEFQSFKSSVNDFCSQNEAQPGGPDFKHITIATPAANVKLLVNAREARQLNDLLQHAAFALEIEKLIAFED
jgi:hypothetical protein